MRFAALLVALVLIGGCGKGASSPSVEAWSTTGGQLHEHGQIIQNYGSHVIVVKNAPVLVRMYLIDRGATSLVASLELDPAIHPIAAVTPTVRAGQAVVELLAQRVVRTGTGATTSGDLRAVTFPLPRRFGCNLSSCTVNPVEETTLLQYWVRKGDDGIGVADGIPLSRLAETTAKQDVAFVVITVDPAR